MIRRAIVSAIRRVVSEVVGGINSVRPSVPEVLSAPSTLTLANKVGWSNPSTILVATGFPFVVRLLTPYYARVSIGVDGLLQTRTGYSYGYDFLPPAGWKIAEAWVSAYNNTPSSEYASASIADDGSAATFRFCTNDPSNHFSSFAIHHFKLIPA